MFALASLAWKVRGKQYATGDSLWAAQRHSRGDWSSGVRVALLKRRLPAKLKKSPAEERGKGGVQPELTGC